MTGGRVLLAVVAVLGVGGCGIVAPDAVARPLVSGAASSAPPVDRAALQARASAAMIPARGLSAIGVPGGPKYDEVADYAVTAACGERVTAETFSSTVGVAHNRIWDVRGWWISNSAHILHPFTGVDIVQQVKRVVESCTTFSDPDYGDVTHTGEIQLPVMPGIDSSYAYCQTQKQSGETLVNCHAILAKGPIVSTVWTTHGSSLAENVSGVQQVAAIAAGALRNAPG